MTNDDGDGLICAYLLDGEGGAAQIGWREVDTWQPDDGILWVHLNRAGERSGSWLRTRTGVAPSVCEALLAPESRPRVTRIRDALLTILRGANFNPGADPEDMVGVRMWFEAGRIITVRHRRLLAIEDIRDELGDGHGPKGPGDFLVRIAERLTDRIGPVVDEIEDRVDELEEQVVHTHSASLRHELADMRQTSIALRRYLAPQRDAVARLQSETPSWLDDMHRSFLHEVSDRTTRFVEDLDAARERAAITQDELNNRLSEQMNKTIYLLTVVATVLLPPSLITGLLGINVGGIPGVDSNLAFTVVALGIALLAAVEIVVLRRLKWI